MCSPPLLLCSPSLLLCSTVASHSPGKLRNPGNSQQFPNPKSLEKTKKTKKTKFWEPNGEGYGLMPHWASKIWFFWFFWFSRGFWVFANLRIPPGALKSIQGINLFSHLLECLFFLVKVYLHHRGQFEPCYCCYAFWRIADSWGGGNRPLAQKRICMPCACFPNLVLQKW